tara:strand:- start:45 stop:509 length:465 start_codon:yes stop_codon:yes gene_type:complete
MKKLLYTFIAVSIIFSSCEQEDEQPTSVSILGDWESVEWKFLQSSGYWTSYPNGQKVITYTSSDIEDFWLDLIFLSDGDVIGIDEDGFSMPGGWVKNGNSLIVDDNNFTISTLSASSLIVYSTEEDTSSHYWNLTNDTIYFTERTDTLKWIRNN